MTEQKKNKPAQTFRMGAVKATVWANTTDDGKTFYSVTFSRGYKKGDEWKDTDSFGRDDLPKVEKLAGQAYAWIFEQSAKKATDEGEE